jgi:hypothetical protein
VGTSPYLCPSTPNLDGARRKTLDWLLITKPEGFRAFQRVNSVVSLSWSSTSLHHVSLAVPRCGQSLRRCWDLCDGISKAESGTRHTSICASSRDITCLPAALGCLKPSQLLHPTTLNIQNLPHDWTNLALPRTKGKRNPLLRSTRIHTRTLPLTPIQSVLRIDPIDLPGMTIADIAATDTIPVFTVSIL